MIRRRQYGMAANPLSYQELESFRRQTLVELSAWETALLMRLDDAMLEAISGSKPTATDKPDDDPIPVTDMAALRARLKSTAAQARLIQEAREAKRSG